MAKEEKKQLTIPEIPNVVQGDGRYAMAQIRKYLREIAVQVNLANGFEGVPETSSGYAAPPGFVLRFNMDGGQFSWNDVSYLKELAYYELRTDKNVGYTMGLLERTTNNASTKLPVTASATVYLYAVLQDKTYSNPSVLTYTKARPEAPQKISLVKSEQGTLIQFTEIPLDCVGAHVYVDGIRYETADNIYLYTGDAANIEEVSVAYYDQFGDGERKTIYNNVPAVDGFIVERNGASIDLYWDPVSIYGVQYVVQVSSLPAWGSGVELFRTALTRKKVEYPNTGNIYFLIKAYDEHGNYSKEAAWYMLGTETDISRNVIMTFDQESTGYAGNKIGTYYDGDFKGLRLADGIFEGEYLFKGELPKRYKARNWAEYLVNSITDAGLRIIDLDFSLNDGRSSLTTIAGGVIGNNDVTDVRTYIAGYVGADTDDLFLASLDGTVQDDAGRAPSVSQHTSQFAYGRWFQGLSTDELTRLAYTYTNQVQVFHSVFCLKLAEALDTCCIAVWSGAQGEYLELGYDHGFYLRGSDGKEAFVDFTPEALDCLTFGVSQGDEERALYIKSMNTIGTTDKTHVGTVNAAPVGVLTSVRFYKGE